MDGSNNAPTASEIVFPIAAPKIVPRTPEPLKNLSISNPVKAPRIKTALSTNPKINPSNIFTPLPDTPPRLHGAPRL